MKKEKTWMRQIELAKKLKVTPARINQMIREGKLEVKNLFGIILVKIKN